MRDGTEDAGADDDYRSTLSNGRGVRIRPLLPGELHVVRDLCSRLSPRTHYLRFFSPWTSTPEPVLRMLAEVDDSNRLALIAELDDAGGGVVGLGNAIAVSEDCAELALVVADAWQRQGIGAVLAVRLLRAADARGFKRFVVHGLWDNAAVRPILKRTADVVSARMRFGVAEFHFRRPPAEETLVAPDNGHSSAPESGAINSDAAVERAYQTILLERGRESWPRLDSSGNLAPRHEAGAPDELLTYRSAERLNT
jgi:GNAT superfamily N-acetyltransferase